MKVDLRREMWGDLVNFKTYTNCLSVPKKLGMSHITISCYKKDFISHFGIIGSYNPWCAGQGVGSILEYQGQSVYYVCDPKPFPYSWAHRNTACPSFWWLTGPKLSSGQLIIWESDTHTSWGWAPSLLHDPLFFCLCFICQLVREDPVGAFRALKHEQGRRSLVPWATVWRIVA